MNAHEKILAHMISNGGEWASIKAIADGAGLAEMTSRVALATLARRGLLEKRTNWPRRAGGGGVEYRITAAGMAEGTRSPPSHDAQSIAFTAPAVGHKGRQISIYVPIRIVEAMGLEKGQTLTVTRSKTNLLKDADEVQ